MTILTSILGTKAFGLLLVLWQASPAASPAAGGNEFTITEMVKNMGSVAITVVIILLIMSVYSIAIMVERYLTYTAAKKQSREFAPRVAQALKNNRIEEAINISDKHRKSHLAMVVNSGLQEFRAHEQSSEISGDEIEASKRALRAMISLFLVFSLELSLAMNDEHPVFDIDLEIFFLHFRQVRFHEKLLVILDDIHRRRPGTKIALSPSPRGRLAKE